MDFLILMQSFGLESFNVVGYCPCSTGSTGDWGMCLWVGSSQRDESRATIVLGLRTTRTVEGGHSLSPLYLRPL